MRRRALAAAAVLLVGAGALAKPVAPTQMPIARLIANVEAYRKSHPKDADAAYTLGRIHYFAFASREKPDPKQAQWEWRKADHLPVIGGDPLPWLYGFGDTPGKSPTTLPSSYRRTPQQQAAHVREAVSLLSEAVRLRGAAPTGDLAKRPGLFELCLACALDDGAQLARAVGKVPGLNVAAEPKAWREEAIRWYRLAYERASESDLKDNVRFGPSVTEEAAESWKRMVLARGPSVVERAQIVGVNRALSTLKAMPMAVTPIVFALEPRAGIASLVDPARRVAFDLDGSGRPQRVSWVRPDTAILVWDPEGTGRIVSGRQLFGSATWWMFWSDGYRALDALDDDRDGWLSGRELSGLALWFDRNGNAVSDPGEVVALAATPVEGIATRATGSDAGMRTHPRGLRLRGGAVLPTWDWVADGERAPATAR